MFVAQGYHAAAMDDIAERAGVSKPVLYQHFPGKLDLYLALLDQSCETIIGSVRAGAGSRPTDNKQRVPPRCSAYFDYVADDRAARSGWSSSPTWATSRPCAQRVDRVTD